MAQYPGKVRFVSENTGESKLAERFGIKRYPAVFVEDVLIATPRDFGFFGEGENAGRYTPWRDARNHEKFKQDLARMIGLILQGKKSEIASQSADAAHEVASLPAFALTDLTGRSLSAKDVAKASVYPPGTSANPSLVDSNNPNSGKMIAFVGTARLFYFGLRSS